MAKEYETKVLDIPVEETTSKLRKICTEEKAARLFRRWIFDINPEKDEWIRVRDEGDKSTLTYKIKRGRGISDTEEIEVIVSNAEATAEILSKTGAFKDVYYQENIRKLFTLGDLEFSIDSWPGIPTYLEIESPLSEKKVREGLRLLNLEGKDVGHMSVKDIYDYYGMDLHSFKNLRM